MNPHDHSVDNAMKCVVRIRKWGQFELVNFASFIFDAVEHFWNDRVALSSWGYSLNDNGQLMMIVLKVRQIFTSALWATFRFLINSAASWISFSSLFELCIWFIFMPVSSVSFVSNVWTYASMITLSKGILSLKILNSQWTIYYKLLDNNFKSNLYLIISFHISNSFWPY